ncbi:MAG: M42 family metallopeptidase [Firmicutes bacterium]|nr:M42 family metallopeptidase [Bacillota bacterium]
MLKYMEELCMMPGISGYEDEVADVILDIAVNQCHVDTVRKDVMGNLIVTKKAKEKSGKKLPKLMLAAHMDEVGFMVKKIEDNGYLRFVPVGGIDKRVVLGHKVYIGPDMVPGVIGLKAFHMVTKEEERHAPDYVEMYIDIGARSREEAEKLVSKGDQIVFHSDFVRFGNGMIKAKAIDDRFGCALMLNLLEEDLPMDLTCAFTVQEEVGLRGAYGAAYAEKPDIALIIEGASSADVPAQPKNTRVTQAGLGPVISCMDSSAIYDEGLFRLLTGLADEAGIPWQIKTRIAGGTDAGAVQTSRAGVRVANVSVCCRYAHTASLVISEKDADDAFRLVKLFVEAVAGGKAKK